MKIVFDEQEINALYMALNQIKVEGFQQAKLLVLAEQMLSKGEKQEERKETKQVDKEGK